MVSEALLARLVLPQRCFVQLYLHIMVTDCLVDTHFGVVPISMDIFI